MKLALPPAFVLVAALLGILSSAHAQVSPIRLRVEQVTKSESEKNSKTQTRSLKIFVSNSGKEPAEVVAKYVIFGRDVKENDVVKLNEGEKPVSVKPLDTQMVESPVVTSVSMDGKPAKVAKAGTAGAAGTKKTGPTGTKILGYAVQVFQGEKMVAEAYDPQSMKEQMGKAAAANPAPQN